MAFLSPFLLGRPGYELSFDVNPEAMDIEEAQIAAFDRTLAGVGKKWVFATYIPTIKVNSSWFPIATRNQFVSLLSVADTFLSFQTRDDWQMQLEQNASTSATTVPVQVNSATRLGNALVAAGFASTIIINGVFDNPAGTGTNYFTGGSYSDANYTITLGSPLAVQGFVYVTYTYKGWFVDLQKISSKFAGGKSDLGSYDYQLVGV